jgi:hypothetical protein
MRILNIAKDEFGRRIVVNTYYGIHSKKTGRKHKLFTDSKAKMAPSSKFVVAYHWNDHGGFVLKFISEESTAREDYNKIPAGAARTLLHASTGEVLEKWGDYHWSRKVHDYATIRCVCRWFGFDMPPSQEVTQFDVSVWGHLSFKAQDSKEGHRYLIKVPISTYSRESVEMACCVLSHPQPVHGNGLCTKYNRTQYPVYRSVVGITSTNDIPSSPIYTVKFGSHIFIAIRMIENAIDLSCTLPDSVMQRMDRVTKRVFLARGIGFVQAITPQDSHYQLPPHVVPEPREHWVEIDDNHRWDWIGNASSRIRFALKRLDEQRQNLNQPLLAQKTEEVLHFLLHERCARVDALPVVAGTGDLQLKNILYRPERDEIIPINLEILVPMLRVWDMAWLLLLDDAFTGLHGSPYRWLYEFGVALRIHRMHNHGQTLTDEEIFLFPNIVQIRMAMITGVMKRCEESDGWIRLIEDQREAIRHVLCCVHCGERIPCPVTFDPTSLASSFPFAEEALTGVHPKTGLMPVVMFYNGTFAPAHVGHLDAVYQAASCLNNDRLQIPGFTGKRQSRVIASVFSPCHPAYASQKLGHLDAFNIMGLESCRWRVGWVMMAIHSARVVSTDIPLSQFFPCVDTHEVLHCSDVVDLNRIRQPLLRVRHTLARYNIQDFVYCIVMGSDGLKHGDGLLQAYLAVDPSVHCCIVQRGEDAETDSAASLISPTLLEGGRIHITTHNPKYQHMSSTKIRKVWGDGNDEAVREKAVHDAVGIPSVAGYLLK